MSLCLLIFPRAALLAIALLLAGCGSRAAVPTPRHPTTNEYHGMRVVDEYQWLENTTNPAVRRWSAAQNEQARTVLDRLPARPAVEARLRQLFAATSANYFALTWRHGKLFLLKFLPPAQQPVLITLSSPDDLKTEHVILDPQALDPTGSTTIDWFEPSPDGRLVAVSLSQHGSEEGTLHFYETATGRALPDALPRAQVATGGGSAAWTADSQGVFYTRYPRSGERPPEDLDFFQQIYFHRLGTPEDKDGYEFGRELPRIAEISLETSPDGRRLLARVANGDGGDYAHYLRDSSGRWTRVAGLEDHIKQAEFGREPLYIELDRDDALYLLSTRNAPHGKILRLPLDQPALTNATLVIPEGTNVIRDFKPTASGLALVFLNGGPEELTFVDLLQGTLRGPEFKQPTAVGQIVVTHGDEILYRTETDTEPFTWWRYDPNQDAGRIESTALFGKSPVPFSDVEAVRAMATSKDGTSVPMTIIRKKGTRLNGENPTVLKGYGGYGISESPGFDFTRRVWLDQGGVIAVANLRGGGEFGETWHEAGNLLRKQNVFDDFAACAEFLIRSNYTRTGKLAIEGGSNGGLLMGALLTQRPELFQAVVSHVGIYDMLRVELDPNGAFNVTEFGTVRDPTQFQALYGYSPYHQVRERTLYPAVLMLTGENDGRVNPAHSRKMTARLQTATRSGKPVLLRTSSGSGHGQGTALEERIQQLADVQAFLFDQLGLDYSLVDRGPWSGAITPTSAVIKARLVQPDLTARLVVSKNPKFTRRLVSEPVRSETNHHEVVAFPLERLQPDTRYYYALEIDGRLDRKRQGEFRTFPAEGPASFSIAFASCARTASTSEVFDRIREHQPLFYMNMGDFHYLNIATNDRSRFRAAYDFVLSSPQQSDLYRHVPFVYIWDDHDFGGNNSNRKSSSHEAARLSYEEYVPHYPLAAGDGDVAIYQSFTVGRVRFILTDLRSERDAVTNKDTAKKSMLGARQKAWFKNELLSANGRYPLICWVSSVPWIGQAGSNIYRAVKTNDYGYFHHTNLPKPTETETPRTNRNRLPGDEDHWSVFSTERREIADFIRENDIRGVCILHGDSHMLAADDGSHSDYATGGGAPLPVMCAAPLDQEPSLKGGPYSQGVYRVKEGEGCFGLLTVTDLGDQLQVAFSGLNYKDEEKISLRFAVPVAAATSEKKSRPVPSPPPRPARKRAR